MKSVFRCVFWGNQNVTSISATLLSNLLKTAEMWKKIRNKAVWKNIILFETLLIFSRKNIILCFCFSSAITNWWVLHFACSRSLLSKLNSVYAIANELNDFSLHLFSFCDNYRWLQWIKERVMNATHKIWNWKWLNMIRPDREKALLT